jgi:hypothetical protein
VVRHGRAISVSLERDLRPATGAFTRTETGRGHCEIISGVDSVKRSRTGIYHGKSTRPLSAAERKTKLKNDRLSERFAEAALDGLRQGAGKIHK